MTEKTHPVYTLTGRIMVLGVATQITWNRLKIRGPSSRRKSSEVQHREEGDAPEKHSRASRSEKMRSDDAEDKGSWEKTLPGLLRNTVLRNSCLCCALSRVSERESESERERESQRE